MLGDTKANNALNLNEMSVKSAAVAVAKVASAVAKDGAKAVAKQGANALVVQEGAKKEKKIRYNRWYFPNEIIQFMNPAQVLEQTEPQQTVKVKVHPRLTKIEVKNFVEALYDTPVTKVNTINYEGKIRRNNAGRSYYKDKDFKVAYCILETPWDPRTVKK